MVSHPQSRQWPPAAVVDRRNCPGTIISSDDQTHSVARQQIRRGLAMKMFLALVLVCAVTVGFVPYARSLGSPASPPGIAAKNWIPFGETAGFVITGNGFDPKRGLRSENPNVVTGYFMIRRADKWVRIDSSPQPEVHPAVF
jgi:hypothetical protein